METWIKRVIHCNQEGICFNCYCRDLISPEDEYNICKSNCEVEDWDTHEMMWNVHRVCISRGILAPRINTPSVADFNDMTSLSQAYWLCSCGSPAVAGSAIPGKLCKWTCFMW
jgi:hypothetical protein